MKGNVSIRGSTELEREFIKDFESLCNSHNPWTVWQDFVDISAITLSNAVDKREMVWKKREERYLETVKKYSRQELDIFTKLFSETVMALDENPAQDFLGKLYMNFNFGGRSGQFFTPWSVAKLMAELVIGDNFRERLEAEPFLSVNDPACGAGCMLIAFANLCRENYGINYQQRIIFVAQDVDPVVAKMCYIQLSLLSCPGYVVVGNTITEPVLGTTLCPWFEDQERLWFTPVFFTDVWNFRRLFQKVANLTEAANPEQVINRPETDVKRTPPKVKVIPKKKTSTDPTSFSIREFFKKAGWKK